MKTKKFNIKEWMDSQTESQGNGQCNCGPTTEGPDGCDCDKGDDEDKDVNIYESSNFGPHKQAGKALNGQKIKEVYYDMGTYYIELANGKYISFDVGGMMPTIGKASALKGM
jgi:hypothetical protein